MPDSSPRKNQLLIALLALVVGTALGGGIFFLRQRNAAPEPGSPPYREMVTTFYTGLVALEVGDTARALDRMQAATRLVPQEPASWANLALLQLRANNLEAAGRSLEQAQRQAPHHPRIEMLAAVLESRQGDAARAIARLRSVASREPGNARARYALVEELGRQGAAGSDEEIQRQLRLILERDPDNLFVTVELARSAVKTGTADLLREMVTRLKPQSTTWPPDARAALDDVERLAASGSLGPRPTFGGYPAGRLAVMGNLLIRTPRYRQSADAVRIPATSPGEPIETFLRLPAPIPSPSPPDTGLTFNTEPVPPLRDGRAGWVGAAYLSAGLPQSAFREPQPVQPDGAVAILAADQRRLRIYGDRVTTLPFPGDGTDSPGLLDGGALAADWNNDYRLDLALVGRQGLLLYQQESPARFRDVTKASGLPASVRTQPARALWAADIESDGDLDLVLAQPGRPPLALRNNGDGSWTTQQPFPAAPAATGFAWADFDGDSDGDPVFLGEDGRLVAFANERGGQFRSVGRLGEDSRFHALTVADADRDGALDLVALGAGGVIMYFRWVEGAEGWQGAELVRWDGPASEDHATLFWADLDNNGSGDLIATTQATTQAWLSDAARRLQPLATQAALRTQSVVDLNGDGRLDLLGTNGGAVTRLINRGAKEYGWQELRPRANAHPGEDQRINSFGLGGQAEVRAGLLHQLMPIGGPVVHFGLGEHAKANYARILWPNGSPQGEFELQPRQAMMAEQRLTGSCPWLFAWNGRRMEFVTDFLWSSPLGLRINAQDTAGVVRTGDWVKIRGDQLPARDGQYDLRLTAELWETHFWDHASLMVVDHPAGTEVWIDERFAIPPPDPRIHMTARLTPVARATDDRGQDVTDLVHARDGRYLGTFGNGAYMGITRDHYVEVELTPVPAGTGPLWLVGQGWVHPTDSSINVALGQGRYASPRSLSIEVYDGAGRWRTARDKLGFPAGKSKTALFDLTGLLPADVPPRLRLRTNLEVYWDALAVTRGLPDTALRRQVVAPAVADLRYRGFSAARVADAVSPEIPDYEVVARTGPQWHDLIGLYTRFGDVRELLDAVDDRYLIVNAGDELALSFPAPPPPPAGWVRDFVFASDGWNKDGNLNTAFSKTVLPLPSHAWPSYDRPAGRLEDDPVFRRHRRDWETYHTRYVTADGFRNALRGRRR